MTVTVSHTQKGFTLVELAVVLAIIGLLIGGVLRGQEIYENAQITATIEQVHAYKGALVTFEDKYSMLPGDMALALTRLPGCSATTHCGNGDGNNFIGNNLQYIQLIRIQTGTAMPDIETTYFWKHLALSHLISGVSPAADPARPEWGVTHPTAKINGGFMVVQGRHHPTGKPDGVWVILSNNLTGYTAYNPGSNPLTPRQAYKFDMKMDDGMADLGDVGAPDYGDCDTGGSQAENRRYWTQEPFASAKNCVLVFRIL